MAADRKNLVYFYYCWDCEFILISTSRMLVSQLSLDKIAKSRRECRNERLSEKLLEGLTVSQ